jgi:hypothetical protein
MIRRLILAAAAVAMTVVTSASAETVFAGIIRTTAATAPCQFYDVGRIDASQFHPNIAGNANFSAISFLQPLSAVGYKLNGLAFDATFRNVITGGIGWGDPFNWTGSQVKIFFQSPATITATTPQLLLRGQIKKPENDPGGIACIITFSGSYVLRPF